MFRGTLLGKCDAKGRLVVPRKFREVFEKSKDKGLALTGDPRGYLLLMPQNKYFDYEKKILNSPERDNRAVYFKQVVVGMADVDQQLDKLGRITLSPAMIEHAKIKTEVAFVGSLSSLRIWSNEEYLEFNQQFRDSKSGDRFVLPEGWEDGLSI